MELRSRAPLKNPVLSVDSAEISDMNEQRPVGLGIFIKMPGIE
jgi:hypothetical protein